MKIIHVLTLFLSFLDILPDSIIAGDADRRPIYNPDRPPTRLTSSSSSSSSSSSDTLRFRSIYQNGHNEHNSQPGLNPPVGFRIVTAYPGEEAERGIDPRVSYHVPAITHTQTPFERQNQNNRNYYLTPDPSDSRLYAESHDQEIQNSRRHSQFANQHNRNFINQNVQRPNPSVRPNTRLPQLHYQIGNPYQGILPLPQIPPNIVPHHNYPVINPPVLYSPGQHPQRAPQLLRPSRPSPNHQLNSHESRNNRSMHRNP